MRIPRVAILAIVALALPFLAVPAKAATPLKIGVAYDTGGPGDYSYNDAVAAGVESAKKRYYIEVLATVTIGSDADRELRLNSLISKGAQYIIAVGKGYAPAVERASLLNSKVQFGIVNDASVKSLNVSSLVFNEKQGGYLAGAAAALISKTEKVGILANSAQGKKFEIGFSRGARSVKKSISVSSRYGADHFGDLAKELIAGGVDVIFIATAGSDSEVLATLVDANKNGHKISFIGIEPDQYVSLSPTAKKYILASVVKRVDRVIVDFVSAAQTGLPITDILDPIQGIYGRNYGIVEGGIELSVWSYALTKFKREIKSATIRARRLAIINK